MRRWGVAVTRQTIVVGVSGHHLLPWRASRDVRRWRQMGHPSDVDFIVVRRSSPRKADWGVRPDPVPGR
jgi:hypothetical protein